MRDLVGVNVEMLSQLGYRVLAPDGRQRHLCLEGRCVGYQAQSELDEAEGKQAALGGELGAAGDLLSGASGTLFNFNNLKKTG